MIYRMKGIRIMEELFSQLKEWGYKGRIVAIQHLGDLQEEIEGRYRQGLFDEEFYQEWLARFVFSPPDSLPEARSMIIVAIPQPQTWVTFTWDREPVRFIIPPTYFEQGTENRVRELLARVLGPSGININAIAPGFFLGKQNRALLVNQETGEYTQRGQAVINHTPVGRFGEAEELIGATLFLASYKASGFVTGISIPVDGGYLAFNI